MAEVTNLRPSEIFFSVDKIPIYYIKEHLKERMSIRIDDLFTELLEGRTRVDHLPRLEVINYEGKYWISKNKYNNLLYIFKKLQEYKRIEQVEVDVHPCTDSNLKNFLKSKDTGDGVSVFFHSHSKMDERFLKIYSKRRFNEGRSQHPQQDNLSNHTKWNWKPKRDTNMRNGDQKPKQDDHPYYGNCNALKREYRPKNVNNYHGCVISDGRFRKQERKAMRTTPRCSTRSGNPMRNKKKVKHYDDDY